MEPPPQIKNQPTIKKFKRFFSKSLTTYVNKTVNFVFKKHQAFLPAK